MTQIGAIYGRALYDLAKANGKDETILSQITMLAQCFRTEPDFLRLLAAPNIPKVERCEVLERCFQGKMEQYLLNFLKILTEKGMIRHFADCCRAYRRQYDEDHQILTVNVVTAVELTAAQQKDLIKKLTNMTKKKIRLEPRVEPGVLGGLRLDLEGRRLDGTLTQRLKSLQRMLKSG